MYEQVVAVGFLTQSDLDVLGLEFTRCFPVEHEDIFAELLEQLEHVEATPLGHGVAIMPNRSKSER